MQSFVMGSLINNNKQEPMSRLPQIRSLLAEQVIEELLAKFVLNLNDRQQTEDRLAYHFKAAYYCFLNKFGLTQQIDTKLCIQEEVFFMKKLNEYLPDFIRVQSCAIPIMHYYCSLIPVYGAIISRNNQKEYLLVQDRRTGKYGFCKGKISEGETPEECVAREAMEEIGLRIHSFGKYFDANLTNGKVYTFIEAQLHEDHHAKEDIVYEGNRQIVKLVWWSLPKIRQVCNNKSKGKQQMNAPTKLVFQKIQWSRKR